MDFEAILAQWVPLLKKYWLPIVLGFCGLIFFAYGLIALLGSFSKSQDITLKSASAPSNSNSTSQNLIQVDVEGAIVSPGVYKLASTSIIKDALVAAKGLSADADRDWVAKGLNLAAKLSDGAKIYIPRIGETVNSNQQSLSSNLQSSNLININTASSQDLDSLPGVGPATATKIINARPYSNINELLDKKVVSSKVFDQIKDKISIY
jgi:competence protein ComEA